MQQKLISMQIGITHLKLELELGFPSSVVKESARAYFGNTLPYFPPARITFSESRTATLPLFRKTRARKIYRQILLQQPCTFTLNVLSFCSIIIQYLEYFSKGKCCENTCVRAIVYILMSIKKLIQLCQNYRGLGRSGP